jgi:hypothetical protein
MKHAYLRETGFPLDYVFIVSLLSNCGCGWLESGDEFDP